MGDPAGTRIRPLARSLDPLTGESLGGYLLRLAHRLCLSPVKLARWIGCDCAPLSRRLLFDLDPAAFAAAARLSPGEAATLTLAPWADRYPPIARALTRRSTQVDYWLFNAMPRYCPQCLAGDGSPVQEQHGGPWKRAWHLPVSFACPDHQVFLRHSCPEGHPPSASSRLITSIGDSTLHPAQCRHPRRTGWPGPSSSCGARLDQAGATQIASHALLATQQRLLAALNPHHPAEAARQFFTDLRVITTLLCASWPASQELLEPAMAGPVAGHVSQLRSRASGNLSPPPEDPVAAGALLSAAVKIRDSNDLHAALSRYHEAARAGPPSRSPWAKIVDRHANSCSPALRDAAEPLVRGYRRQSGPHSPEAPARNDGYRPEHIPAFLEDAWFKRHLAQLNCKNRLSRVLRRTAAATLVQWSAGGSLGDAAAYLGINPNGGQFSPTSDRRRSQAPFPQDGIRAIRDNVSLSSVTPAACRNMTGMLIALHPLESTRPGPGRTDAAALLHRYGLVASAAQLAVGHASAGAGAGTQEVHGPGQVPTVGQQADQPGSPGCSRPSRPRPATRPRHGRPRAYSSSRTSIRRAGSGPRPGVRMAGGSAGHTAASHTWSDPPRALSRT